MIFILSEVRRLPRKVLSKIPAINFEDLHESELINVSQNGIFESGSTERLLENEIQESHIKNTKLALSDFTSHSQSIKRAVKLTSESSDVVYGFEARHDHVIAETLRRQI